MTPHVRKMLFYKDRIFTLDPEVYEPKYNVCGVLIIGDAYIDFVFSNLNLFPNIGEEIIVPTYELRPGGSAGYTAMVLASLGIRVSITSNVGDDFLSKYWLDSLSELGVGVKSVSVIKGKQIGAGVVFLHKTDRSFITFRGANAINGEKHVDNYEGIEFLLITGFSQAPYLWNTIFAQSIKKVKRKGTTIALDTNWSSGEWLKICEKIIPHLDYLMINDTELTKLAGKNDIYQAGQNLVNKGVDTCIIKRGSSGCTIIKKDYMRNIPADDIEPVDLNGAGDFFNAGFTYGYLHGWEEVKSCKFANQCAKCAISNFTLSKKISEVALLKDRWRDDI